MVYKLGSYHYLQEGFSGKATFIPVARPLNDLRQMVFALNFLFIANNETLLRYNT